MNVGSLYISLAARTAGLASAQVRVKQFEKSVIHSVQRINAGLMSVGKNMTAFTIPIAVVGGAAVSMFSDFEFYLTKVTGLIGIAKEQTDAWGKQILDMAPKVAQTPKALAESLYFITSAGIRGADTMEVLETSALAASAGMGSVKQVSDLLTSAMNAYGKENLNAAKAMDILTTTVREGKKEASEMTSALGVVFPVAAKLEVSFDQVGASLAAMTRTGTEASMAATGLRRVLTTFLQETPKAERALNAMGTSFAELRLQMKEEGLMSVLLKINDLVSEMGEEYMAKVFPNIRALVPVLDILGNNLENNKVIFDNLTNSVGSFDKLTAHVAETFKFKFNAFIAEASVALTKLGEVVAATLIPNLTSLTKLINNIAQWFGKLSRNTQDTIIKFILFTAVIGPIIVVVSTLIQGLTNLVIAFKLVIVTISRALYKAVSEAIIYLGIFIKEIKAVGFAASVANGGLKVLAGSLAVITGAIAAVIAIVGTLVYKWFEASNAVSEYDKALARIEDASLRGISDQVVTLDKYIAIIESEISTQKEKEKALKSLNGIIGEHVEKLNMADTGTFMLRKSTNDYIKKLKEEQIELSATEQLMEAYAEKQKVILKLATNDFGFFEKIGRFFKATYDILSVSDVLTYKDALAKLNSEMEKGAEDKYYEVVDAVANSTIKATGYVVAFEKAWNDMIRGLRNEKPIRVPYLPGRQPELGEGTGAKLMRPVGDGQFVKDVNIVNVALKDYTASLKLLERSYTFFGDKGAYLNEVLKLQGDALDKLVETTRGEFTPGMTKLLKLYRDTEADLEAYNASIAKNKKAVEEQKEAAKRLAEAHLNSSPALKLINSLEIALGDSYDANAAKVSHYTAQITALLRDGVHPLSEGIKLLQAELAKFEAMSKADNIKLPEFKMPDAPDMVPTTDINLMYEGLQGLNDELSKLQRLQNVSLSPEQYKATQKEIDIVTDKIRNFKGEAVLSQRELAKGFRAIKQLASSLSSTLSDLGSILGESFTEAMEPVVKLLDLLSSIFGVIQSVTRIMDIFGLSVEAVSAAKKKDTIATAAGIPVTLAATAAKNQEAAANAGAAISGAASSTSWIPIVGVALAIAGIAALVMAMTSGKRKAAKMAKGGMVPGGYPNDSYAANLSSGELVVPANQSKSFLDIVKQHDIGGSNRKYEFDKQEMQVNVIGQVRGTDIHYIVQEIERKNRNSF